MRCRTLALFPLLILASMPGRARAQAKPPAMPLLERWEGVVDAMIPIPRPVAVVPVERGASRNAVLFWPDAGDIVALSADETGSPDTVFLRRYDLMTGKTTLLRKGTAGRELPDPFLGTTLAPRADGGWKLAWSALPYPPGRPQMRAVPLPDALRAPEGWKRASAPVVGVRYTFARHRGDSEVWQDTPLAWYDTAGRAVVKGRLPGRIAVRETSPRALRRTADGALWAFTFYDQGQEGYGDVPARDLGIARIRGGKVQVEVVPRQERPPVPMKTGWRFESRRDAPAWLAYSETLVYRRTWNLQAATEQLSGREVWMRLKGGAPRLVEALVSYQGPGETSLVWAAGPDGRPREMVLGDFGADGDADMKPFPAQAGSGIVYYRRGAIVARRLDQ